MTAPPYSRILNEKRARAEVHYLFAGGKRVASVWLSGDTQFYHTDHMGSTNVVTDQSGTLMERNEFYPYGTYRVQEGAAPVFTPIPARRRMSLAFATSKPGFMTRYWEDSSLLIELCKPQKIPKPSIATPTA